MQDDSQLQGIKQEPIDVDELPNTANLVWPASTIKRSIEEDIPRVIKRVKFEDDAPVDMSLYKDFPSGGDQIAVDDEIVNETGSPISGEGEVIDLDAEESVAAEKDERSEEEKREEAEQKAKVEAEVERERLETEKQFAAYMEQLRSQM